MSTTCIIKMADGGTMTLYYITDFFHLTYDNKENIYHIRTVTRNKYQHIKIKTQIVSVICSNKNNIDIELKFNSTSNVDVKIF